jgi:metallo-beta-lactamase class B
MLKRTCKEAITVIIFSIIPFLLPAQKVNEPKTSHSEWSKPYPPFRIAGNLYYVGTYELGCYLVTSPEGNILINTGLSASSKQIRDNIEKLGFKFSETKILLTTQAHFDHVGAMAEIKKMTGARVMADEQELPVLADGGNSDYAMGGNGPLFAPVGVDRVLRDGDTIRLGNVYLVLLHHPGHTRGSSSFVLNTKDEKRSYTILIANMPTIITEKPFAAVSAYPGMAKDYGYTLAAMKQLTFDIWVASHASQFDLHRKHLPGGGYNPSAFIDRAGYDRALAGLQQEYDKHPGRD